MKQLITEELINAAFEYLNEGASAAAQAAADRLIASHRLDKVFSELLLAAPPKLPADMRKAWAKSQPEYWTACEQEAETVRTLEWHKHQKVRADAIVSAWRTEQASARGIGRMG
jgi:hypothetical protein